MKIKTQMIKDRNRERRFATECEQNEFLDIRLRINIQKDDSEDRGSSLRRLQEKEQEYLSPPIKQKTKSYANFVQGSDIESTNKRIKSIIKEMKIKQQEKQLQVKEMMKKIQEEKLEEIKTKEFMLAERRIKTRIKLLDKRGKLKDDYLNQKGESVSSNSKSKSNRSKLSKSNTKKHLTITECEEVQQYQRNIENKKISLSRMQSQDDLSQSKTTLLPNPYTKAKIKTKKYANKHVNSISGIIEPIAKSPQAEQQKLYSSFIKNKKDNNTEVQLKHRKVPDQKDNRRRRNNGTNLLTIQRKSHIDPEVQLHSIEKQQQLNIQSARRAASLVERIGVNHRLKKKNMEQQDYTQASNKLKLLSLLYKVQQS